MDGECCCVTVSLLVVVVLLVVLVLLLVVLLLVVCFPRSGWYSFYVMAVGCVLLGVFISVGGELVS